MGPIKIQSSIDVGHIVTILVVVLGIVFQMGVKDARMEATEKTINELKSKVAELTLEVAELKAIIITPKLRLERKHETSTDGFVSNLQ